MFCHLVWNDIYNLSFFFFFLENVSENLQIQGAEMQDSHKAIVKDLTDVRHQAQDIYQKIGNQNTSQSKMNHKHAVQNCFVLISVFRSSMADQTTVCWSSCITRTRRHSTTQTWWTNWSAWTARWDWRCTTLITCRAESRKSSTWSRATWAGQVRHDTQSAVTTFVHIEKNSQFL